MVQATSTNSLVMLTRFRCLRGLNPTPTNEWQQRRAPFGAWIQSPARNIAPPSRHSRNTEPGGRDRYVPRPRHVTILRAYQILATRYLHTSVISRDVHC